MLDDEKMAKNAADKRSTLARFYRIAAAQQTAPTARGVTSGTRSTEETEPVDINAELARRERIKNNDAEQDIRLKRTTLNRLFWFLAIETVLIFFFAFLQATRFFRFHLEDWSFKLLVSATIAQITAMLYVAVSYLFPKGNRKR